MKRANDSSALDSKREARRQKIDAKKAKKAHLKTEKKEAVLGLRDGVDPLEVAQIAEAAAAARLMAAASRVLVPGATRPPEASDLPAAAAPAVEPEEAPLDAAALMHRDVPLAEEPPAPMVIWPPSLPVPPHISTAPPTPDALLQLPPANEALPPAPLAPLPTPTDTEPPRPPDA